MARATNIDTADAVRAELARRRLSGRELAASVGLTERTLRRRLNGSTPFTALELAEVARFLGVPLTDLLPPPSAEPVGAAP